MAMLYTIRNWSEKYENAGSRKVNGPLDWFACPTKHDGLSYRRLMKRKDGMALYGAWIQIVAVAAKCEPRGTLKSDDGPLTAEDIALKTGGDENTLKTALQVFSSKEVPWLTGSTLPVHPDELALQDRTVQDRTGQNITSCTETAEPSSLPQVVESPVVLEFPCDGEPDCFPVRQSLLDEFGRLFPKLDPIEQCREALAWVLAKPANRKTATGMRRFLTGWLTRSSDRIRGGAGPPNGHPTLSDKSRRAEAASGEVLSELFGARE
jgi:hypothetical protein